MHFIFLILMIKSVKLCSYKSALNSLLKPQVFKTSLHPTNSQSIVIDVVYEFVFS